MIVFRTKHAVRKVNLIPFRNIISFLSRVRLSHIFTLGNVCGNILLFVPMGIYFNLFWKDRTIVQKLSWLVLISLGIEILQYSFKIGIGDIDDILLNSFGGWIGLKIDALLRRKWEEETKCQAIAEKLAVLMLFLILIFYTCYTIF